MTLPDIQLVSTDCRQSIIHWLAVVCATLQCVGISLEIFEVLHMACKSHHVACHRNAQQLQPDTKILEHSMLEMELASHWVSRHRGGSYSCVPDEYCDSSKAVSVLSKH